MITTELLGQHQGLTTAGWFVMIGCVGFVCLLCAFCFWRLLRGSASSVRDDGPSDLTQ